MLFYFIFYTFTGCIVTGGKNEWTLEFFLLFIEIPLWDILLFSEHLELSLDIDDLMDELDFLILYLEYKLFWEFILTHNFLFS